jgi:hypothetical protein
MSEPDNEAFVARARRAKAFARRDAAARAGIHVPTVSELLRNQSFCSGSWEKDAQAFTERLLHRIKKEPMDDAGRKAIELIAMAPTIEQCLEGAVVLRTLAGKRAKISEMLEQAAQRCELYAAAQAHVPSMHTIAGYAAAHANSNRTPDDECLQYAESALGWLTVAATCIEPWPRVWRTPFHRASNVGADLLQRVITEQLNYIVGPKEGNSETFGSKLIAMSGQLPPSFDLDAPQSDESVVVLPRVGNEDVGEGKKVKKEFGNLVGQPLPLVKTPNLSSVSQMLNEEFPHAVHVTSAILSELGSRSHVRLPPLLFVGKPGGGKSQYAIRLLELLSVRGAAYPCGGVADSTFAGTSRRWTTGAPTFPIGLMRQHRTASPGVVLDELERASTSRYNGSIFDVLLAMLEPSTAATWMDPYIEAPVNLAHIIWLATANELGTIPAALRDRFRVFSFPSPTADHIPILAPQILRKLVSDLGWDARWAAPLDQEELDALAAAWPGGSLRVLRRYVQGIWRARQQSLTLQ